jgi:hypothetical protein
MRSSRGPPPPKACRRHAPGAGVHPSARLSFACTPGPRRSCAGDTRPSPRRLVGAPSAGHTQLAFFTAARSAATMGAGFADQRRHPAAGFASPPPADGVIRHRQPGAPANGQSSSRLSPSLSPRKSPFAGKRPLVTVISRPSGQRLARLPKSVLFGCRGRNKWPSAFGRPALIPHGHFGHKLARRRCKSGCLVADQAEEDPSAQRCLDATSWTRPVVRAARALTGHRPRE